MLNDFIEYIYILPAALVAIVLHEMAHGYVSYWLGDPTPKEYGRLSFNPIKHIDPLGALCLIFFHVGWAKPVMINPSYYKNPKWGTALVSLAGPLMNFILAFLSAFFMVLSVYLAQVKGISFFEYIYKFFLYGTIINIGLGLFNLIPIPPLDGSKILGAFLPKNAYYQYMKYQRYGMIFLIIILLVMDALTAYGLPSLLDNLIETIYSFLVSIFSKMFFN